MMHTLEFGVVDAAERQLGMTDSVGREEHAEKRYDDRSALRLEACHRSAGCLHGRPRLTKPAKKPCATAPIPIHIVNFSR